MSETGIAAPRASLQRLVAIARALANDPSLILVLVVTHDHRALGVFDALYETEDGPIRPTPKPPSPRPA